MANSLITLAADVAAGAKGIGTVFEVARRYGPAAVDGARKLVRDTVATIRSTPVSTGVHQVYPRVLGNVTWELLAIGDVSLLNMTESPADIEALEATVDGGGTAKLWAPGVHLRAPPPEAGQFDDYGLIVGGPRAQLHVESLLTQNGGFPLVIRPRDEVRVRLGFVFDTGRRFEKTDAVTLRLRCLQRGQRLFRPIAGPITFYSRPPRNQSHIEHDPMTGFLRWVPDSEGSSWAGTM
jgi:hypothetical protein